MNTAISYSLSPLSSPSHFYDCCMTRRRDTSTSKLHFAPPVIYYLFRTSIYSFLGCKGHVFLLVSITKYTFVNFLRTDSVEVTVFGDGFLDILFCIFCCNRSSIFISCFSNVRELLNPLVM
jgi:hypothetical protein